MVFTGNLYCKILFFLVYTVYMDQYDENDGGVDLSSTSGNSNKGIKFEDSSWNIRPIQKPTTSIITRWVIIYSHGLVKNKKQANYVLLAFVGAAIVFSLFVFLSIGGSKAELKAPPGNKIMYPQNGLPRLQHPILK